MSTGGDTSASVAGSSSARRSSAAAGVSAHAAEAAKQMPTAKLKSAMRRDAMK